MLTPRAERAIALAKHIEDLEDQLRASRKAMAAEMQWAVDVLMPDESRVKKYGHPFHASCRAGNDRNAREYERDGEISLDLKDMGWDSATWGCLAHAISPSTGKRMSGRTGNGEDRDHVRIGGRVINIPWTDKTGAAYFEMLYSALGSLIESAEKRVGTAKAWPFPAKGEA